MKKALPTLFVASTALITAASLTVATNGNYAQLRAADNSVQHTITFTKADVVSVDTTNQYEHKITINKKTSSGYDFGCVILVEPGDRGFANYDNYIVYVEDNDETAQFVMTFTFRNVISADSVTLYGDFEEEHSGVYRETHARQTADGYEIVAALYEQDDFYIESIVVQYTCGY